MAIAFAVFALLSLWRDHPKLALSFAIISGVFLVLLPLPGLLAPIESIWMRFARVLGAINSRILMTIFYFLAIMPLGVSMRLFGRDVMRRTTRNRTPSTWEDYRTRQQDRRHYENMF